MIKKIVWHTGNSIRLYVLDTILRSLQFRKGIFNGIFYWFLLLTIIITDIKISIDKSQELGISIVAGVAVVLFFLFIGYILFLVFDYFPKNIII